MLIQKPIIKTAMLIATVLLFQNCDLEGTCYNQLAVPVIRLEMQDSVPINAVTNIDIVYVTYSNCSKLNQVVTSWVADTMSIYVVADYEGCECPNYLPDSIAHISYKPTAARNYILRAFKYDGTILQDTLKSY